MLTKSWTKSTRCGTAQCVEVAELDGAVAVRDSKDLTQAPVAFTTEAWSAFTRELQRGGLAAA